MTMQDGPWAVDDIEHTWLPMPDGIRLAARIWLPQTSEPARFPAILEYIPYRKRDMVRARDERNHPYFSAHGYACLRVDMRGSGDSEGSMPDMYSDEELADARCVIDWIASQPWCTGRVGMFGTSWGGTSALQASVGSESALKAVIANCATTDRFEDDIHWMGGCLLTDSLEWGATLPAILAAPPDSATVGEHWRLIWQRRLDALAFPLDAWIRNRTRGRYWRHGSIKFSAGDIKCPILAIGGWADRYSNSVMGLVAARPDVAWGIVGPWGHHYPDQGEPGPEMSFQDVALTWWDHWLKEDNPGALDWPKLRLWRRAFDAPADRLTLRSGEWTEIANPGGVRTRTLFLSPNGLAAQPDAEPRLFDIPNDIRHGECAGDTGYFGRIGGQPLDQSADDARALCFDTAPLDEDIDLVGQAELSVEIVRDRADAQVVCRLCEVASDGCSNLVTRQVLNLSLDSNLDAAKPFSPAEPMRVTLKLPNTAYRFSRGNRIRLAIGTSYWPIVWPPLQAARVKVSSSKAQLMLPAPKASAPLSIPLPQAHPLPSQKSWHISSPAPLERAPARVSDGCAQSSWRQPPVTVHYTSTGTDFTFETYAQYFANTTALSEVRCVVEHAIELTRPDGSANIRSSVIAETCEGGLSIDASLSVHWDGAEMMQKTWHFEHTLV